MIRTAFRLPARFRPLHRQAGARTFQPPKVSLARPHAGPPSGVRLSSHIGEKATPMSILAITPAHLVEFEVGILTIARFSDGACITLKGKGIAGEFRDCIRTHGEERATATFLGIAGSQPWVPLYKPHRMPRDRKDTLP